MSQPRTNAGRLRKRITIQCRASGVGSRGQRTGDWEDVQNAWANVKPLTGREVELARQMFAKATHRVEIRYCKILTTKHRICLNGRHLNIGHIENVDEANVYQRVLCQEEAA